ncbi:MAG: hypothetical protein GW939_04150 [Candidatus Magasanikbacteria bacterium]|nr:hypothetical protein [Candidatus Magasanikbacteria bacterium]NCS72438.1 hypothetical protein [Candidatus Magasanikbacteria bacterium]
MTKFRSIFFGVVVCLLFALPVLIPTPSIAAFDSADRLGLQFGQQSGLGSRDVREVVASVINVLLSLLGVLFVALIVYAGFLWMTANGNEDQVGRAKKTLYAAVIGLLIISSAYIIAQFVITSSIQATL